MVNIHYAHYKSWKQTALVGLFILLTALLSVQAVYSYQLHLLQQKIKTSFYKEPPIEAPHTEQLLSTIQDIDQHDFYHIINALVEVMPPGVKLEVLNYTATSKPLLTCRAHQEADMITFVNLCSNNNILKQLTLKKSTQESDSIQFILS